MALRTNTPSHQHKRQGGSPQISTVLSRFPSHQSYFRIAHHSPGIQTQWFALSTLAAIKRLKVGVCADRDLISIPGLRGHGFYDADRGVGGDDAVEFEAGFLEERAVLGLGAFLASGQGEHADVEYFAGVKATAMGLLNVFGAALEKPQAEKRG